MLLGLWPMVSTYSTKSQYYLFTFLIIVNCLLMAVITLPCLSNMLFREMDPMIRLMLIGPITFYIASILKYSSIVYRRRSIRDCIEHLENDWTNIENENDWNIMIKNVQVGRNLTVLCGILLLPSTVCYRVILPLWTGKTIIEFNETVRIPVHYGFDVFVDAQKSPMYECIFYTCAVAALISSTVAVTSCNLVAMFVTHACGQFQIVVSRLENLIISVDDLDEEILKRRIKFIVYTHVRVLGFSSKIDEAVREISCVEVAASTLTLCLDEYYCMTEWNNSDPVAILTYAGAFIAFTFNIFLFCYIGELLKGQCDKIERAAYMSDWYKLRGTSGLAIVLIISTGLHPRKIEAGRIVELSFLTFGSIMKTTFAYLNMLRTIVF
nr:olfactory receptor 57 [Gregopimpla kuwanae]